MFYLELCEKHNLKMHSGSSSWSSAGQTSRWCPYHILMSSVIYYWTDPVVTWNLFFNLLRLGEMGDSSLWTVTTIINFHFIFEKEREMFPRIIRVAFRFFTCLVILKFTTPAIIIQCEVIIARYNAILNQSECAHLYNHLRNCTKAR